MSVLSVYFAVTVAGCGRSGIDRYAVSGNVTYQSKPIPVGYVKFEPDSSKGNKGPGAGVPLVDGAFTLPSERGIVGGPHIVTISGNDGIETVINGERAPEGKPLFSRYQTNFDFPKQDTEWNFEVPESAASAAK